jgi:hypothetical protein
MVRRQQSERFAELLDAAEAGRRGHRQADVDTDLVTMVDVVARLTAVAPPATRPDFRDKLRRDLLATIDREGLGATGNSRTQLVPEVRPRGVGRARLALAIGVIGGAVALSGMSLASTGATPGDALYAVKRSSEQAKLIFAGSDADRGRLHLEFARIRLVEASQVSPDATAEVLSDMEREITVGVRMLFGAAMQDRTPAEVETVLAFVQEHRAQLVDLRTALPGVAGTVGHTLDLLADIQSRANELLAALTDGCTVMASDELGPVPAC